MGQHRAVYGSTLATHINMDFYSPLRYPGGKGKIANFLKLLFKKNQLLDGCYVEPYAGGASVALSLLFNEYADRIIINDYDRSVYAFWYSVLNQTDELCRLIFDTPVTIDEWRRQRALQQQKTDLPLLELGFSTFFQNRTNRSGIIKGGVIGGVNQDGNWKIDARFNKSDLIKRIKRIALYRNRIQLYNLDACEMIQQVRGQLPPQSLIYFDPPYYVKGRELYANHYHHQDHADIARVIATINECHWLVSYDNHTVISELYSNFRQHIYTLNYHAAKPNQGEEIMVFSDELNVPTLFDNLNRTAQLSLEF